MRNENVKNLHSMIGWSIQDIDYEDDDAENRKYMSGLYE